MQHEPERKQIRPDIQRIAADLLRGAVGHAPANGPRPTLRLVERRGAGNSKVDELDHPVVAEEEVGGLDVPMDHPEGASLPIPRRVGRRQSRQRLQADSDHCLRRHPHPGSQSQPGEGTSAQELHREVGPPSFHPGFEDPDHVGMANPRAELRLVEETEGPGRLVAKWMQDLERNRLEMPLPGCLEHLSHPAFAERTDEAKRPERVACVHDPWPPR